MTDSLNEPVALLPCPFCGGEAEKIHLDDGDNAGGSCIACTVCQASGNVEFGFKENYVSNWNRRAPPVPADKPVSLLPVFTTDGEERRWRAGRDDWQEYAWQDHCGEPGCKQCVGEIPMTTPRVYLPPANEPVAWRYRKIGDLLWEFDGNREFPPVSPPPGYEQEALYTTPQTCDA